MLLDCHVQFWVRGHPVGTPPLEQGIGRPLCTGCEKPMDTGVVVFGNAVCRVCLDELRMTLWKHMGKVISRR